jgi:hypothetical protein
MIEKLKELIKKEDAEGFKAVFSQSTINAHHRELLYELSYRKQAKEIYEYMDSRASLSPEKRVNVFLKTLQDGTKIKDFNTVKELSDSVLAQNFGRNADHMAKTQDASFMQNFMDAHPLTSFMNFKKLIYTGFKYNHDDFIAHASKKPLDKNQVFYSGLCAVNFKKREAFSTLLANSLKHDEKILDDVKKLKNEYSIVMRGRVSQQDKEEFEAFINEAVIETFAKHLDEVLSVKPTTTIKPKKLKI